MLTREGCSERQEKLRKLLRDQKIDAITLVHPLEIYYFTGMLLPEQFPGQPALLWVDAHDDSFLVAHSDDQNPLVNKTYLYQSSIGGTVNSYLREQVSELVVDCLKDRHFGQVRIGYQREFMPNIFSQSIENGLGFAPEWVAMDKFLYQMQEIKYDDELQLMRKAIEIDLAAYTAAQSVIRPGVNELEVLGAAQQAAHLAAGEKVFHDGDYRSGELGGFARDRKIEEGELYIIDAWAIYRGYWSDLCRTFSVGEPTDIQESIYEHIRSFHDHIGTYLQPGKDSRECARAMDEYIRQHPALSSAGLGHHGGHTIGLRAHQMPDVNPTRGGSFQVGQVVSIEPGSYVPEAQAGVRLENMYLITDDGPENLSVYSMDIRPRS